MYQNNIVSIIVPVYNTERYLSKCLESLINQTYKNIEIICVDDGSTDKSIEILREYQKNQKKFFIYQKENEGLSLARNYGLKYAIGKYICFVDSDDWLDLDIINKAILACEENKSELVMWPYIREFEKKSLPKCIYDESIKIFNKDEIENTLRRKLFGPIESEIKKPQDMYSICTAWGKLYLNRIIKENNIKFTDNKIIGSFEDGYFNIQYFKYIYKVVYIKNYGYHYRKQIGISLTGAYNPTLFEKLKILFDLLNEIIQKEKLPIEYSEALNNRICLSVLGMGLNIVNSNENVLKQIAILNNNINDDVYIQSYKVFDFKWFNIYWKLFYLFAKYRLNICLYCLLKIIRFLIYS